MKKEVVEIRIGTKGDFTFQAKEGFSGSSCVERTRDLEIALRGVSQKVEKTKEFYDDDSNPLKLNLN